VSEDGPASQSPDEPELFGKPDSVAALVDFAESVALADEQERQRHLDAKAGSLAGFVAVALSLEVGLGASVLAGDGLGCAGRALFIACLVLALGGLAAAALFAILGVLVPQGYPGLSEKSIDRLATRAEMQTHEHVLRERRLATVVKVTLGARDTDDRKARALRRASLCLAGGVVAIAAQGLTLPFL
jgi:hypothetical protein